MLMITVYLKLVERQLLILQLSLPLFFLLSVLSGMWLGLQ